MENYPTTNHSDTFSTKSTEFAQSTVPSQTKVNTITPLLIIFLVSAVLFGFSGYYLGKQSSSTKKIVDTTQALPVPSPLTEPQSSPIITPNISDDAANWQTHTITDANLTFSTPPGMTVKSETQINDDTGVPYSLTVYVEKDSSQQNYYQLYGLYRLNIQQYQNSLNAYKEELEPATIKETQISGFPAIEGQIMGERNRLVTHILTDRGMFSLFTAEPTQANKELTDKILATFKFLK